MITVKEQMREVIEKQPEDSTYDEILKELAFRRMVERGLKDSDNGRVKSNIEMKKVIGSWGKTK